MRQAFKSTSFVMIARSASLPVLKIVDSPVLINQSNSSNGYSLPIQPKTLKHTRSSQKQTTERGLSSLCIHVRTYLHLQLHKTTTNAQGIQPIGTHHPRPQSKFFPQNSKKNLHDVRLQVARFLLPRTACDRNHSELGAC